MLHQDCGVSLGHPAENEGFGDTDVMEPALHVLWHRGKYFINIFLLEPYNPCMGDTMPPFYRSKN